MQKRNIIKWLLLFTIFLLSWYLTTSWRTTEFGLSIVTFELQLFTTFITIFPFSLLALLFLKLVRYDLPLKKFVAQILIIAVLVMVLSEVWASSEEYMFKKKCAENNNNVVAQDVSQVRRWPFSNHTLHYYKGDFFAQD